MKWLVLLALGTLASEDLTCVSAGQLLRAGHIPLLVALLGCFLGIYLGDLLLWLAGRLLGRRLLAWRAVASRVDTQRFDTFGHWFDRNSAAAILASRFIPGSRLPMYLAAGTLGRKTRAFFGWTFVAALLWTPLIVLATAILGETIARPLQKIFGHSLLTAAVALLLAFAILRVPRLLANEEARYQLLARVSKIWRWEFWPPWLFYLPVLPWIAWLALRHRSLAVITAANPGIPLGGIVGESKFDILRQLSSPHVLPATLVHSPDDLASATFPLVLKPDVGQRGAGVRIVRNHDDVIAYLKNHPGPTLAQQYHPGPHEAGIFYYRFPRQPRGHIFSITDKIFPTLTGDGSHTLRQLILRHPRYRMQSRTFFARHARQLDRVLAQGEPLQLAHAGNHCQGTLFRDGAHLITPELETTIDRIAQSFRGGAESRGGFHFGRFDVRYSDVTAFKAGQDLAIVELNGIASESTNLYDPAFSLTRAYRTLFAQWRLLFAIAAESEKSGHPKSRWPEFFRELKQYLRSGPAPTLSD